MAIYKNISSKYVIAKMYRDLGLEDPNYELDFIEWMGEALDFIGAASQLERKEKKLFVESFKAPLPQHFVQLLQLQYESEDSGWIYPKYNPTSFNPHYRESENFYSPIQETYSLNPNYIVTSFEEGEIFISYLALPLDEDGYPLVPDNQYFREALFWYCFKKMLMKGYQPKMQGMNYEFAEHQWKFYCTAARNKANYPDLGEYQRFADTWVGLIPAQRMFEKGFNLEDPDVFKHETVRADNLITRPLTVAPETTIKGGDAESNES